MEDNDLDDRLAGLRTEQAGQGEQQTGIILAATRLRRVLRRRKRGDALLAMTAVLIAGVVVAAIVVLVVSLASGGRDEQPASAVGALRTPTEARRATPTSTAAPIETPLPATAQPALVRQDCDAIRGTSYQSEAERAYFQQNCLEPDEEPVLVTNPTRPPSAPTSAPPAVQPTAAPPAPTPVPGSNASIAIGLAVDWILRRGSPSYTTDAGSCSAVQLSGHWVVTCDARLRGCQGSVCGATVSVCVLSDLSAVRPSDQC